MTEEFRYEPPSPMEEPVAETEPTISASVPVGQIRLMATVIRADGTKEDLGTIAYWHKSRFIRFLYKLKLKR